MAELECRVSSLRIEKVEILKFVWDDSYMTSDIRCGREGGEKCNNIGWVVRQWQGGRRSNPNIFGSGRPLSIIPLCNLEPS